MIAAVIRWSANNRLLVLLGAAFLVAWGIYAVRHIPLDAIPDISDNQVIFYVGGERQDDLSAPIPAGAELQIVGALSGG